jgi:hypothetical protein
MALAVAVRLMMEGVVVESVDWSGSQEAETSRGSRKQRSFGLARAGKGRESVAGAVDCLPDSGLAFSCLKQEY